MNCHCHSSKATYVLSRERCAKGESSTTPVTLSSVWGSPPFDQTESQGVCASGGKGAGGGSSRCPTDHDFLLQVKQMLTAVQELIAVEWVRMLKHGVLDADVYPDKAVVIIDMLWAAAAHPSSQVNHPPSYFCPLFVSRPPPLPH